MDYDQDRKSVIDQMMGELDDETSNSLRKPKGEPHGVEIAITVSPKSEDNDGDMDGDSCTDPDCEIPEHHHGETEEGPEGSDYIQQLLKKLG